MVVSVVTADSVSTPQGSPEVDVDPGGTSSIDLTDVLTGEALEDPEDVVGLRVESSRPVTAGLRAVVGDDRPDAGRRGADPGRRYDDDAAGGRRPGGGGGGAVVRLHDLGTTGLVGDVRPALR